MNNAKKPDSRVGQFVAKQLQSLKASGKTQREVALEAGYTNVNMLTMIKNGESKVAMNRIPALAIALEADVGQLISLSLHDQFDKELVGIIKETFVHQEVSEEELAFLKELRKQAGVKSLSKEKALEAARNLKSH